MQIIIPNAFNLHKIGLQLLINLIIIDTIIKCH